MVRGCLISCSNGIVNQKEPLLRYHFPTLLQNYKNYTIGYISRNKFSLVENG